MKVKKAYLYSAIALLLVAASVFFTIFSNNGKAYNYAKKDLSRYVSGLSYDNINISGVDWEQISDDRSDVNAKMASLLKAAAMSANSNTLPAITKGTIDGYDVAVFNYFGLIDEEDNIVTDGKWLNPANAIEFQLNASAEDNKIFADNESLNKLFNDALQNINIADYSYNAITSGYLHEDDEVFISYTEATEGAKEVANVLLVGDKDEIDEVYGEGFYDKLYATPIGQKLKATEEHPLTFGEKSYSTVTISFVLRDSFAKKDVAFVTDDVVFATVTYKDATGSINFVVRVTVGTDGAFTADAYNITKGEIVGTDSETKVPDEVIKQICGSVLNGSGTVEYAPAELSGEWGTGDYYIHVEDIYNVVDKPQVTAPEKDVVYYTLDGTEYKKVASGLTEWDAETDYYTLTKAHYDKVNKEEVTAPAAGVTYYEYLGEYKYVINNVVREDADSDDITPAQKGITLTYTYPEEATDKDKDGNELKGKTVKFDVYPVGVREIKTTYDNISAVKGGFDSADAKKLVAVKTALNTYDSTLKTAKEFFSNNDLMDAYVEAMKAYKADDAKKADYETAYNALIALELEGKTEDDKKVPLTAFENAYDALMRAAAVYYSGKVAADISKANNDYTEALTAFNTFFAEKSAEATAFVEAMKASKADSENAEKTTAYNDAKTALLADSIEGQGEAVAAFESAYDAFRKVVIGSYSNMDKAVEVSVALVNAKEALSVFDNEDVVDAYINAFNTFRSTADDKNKPAYENALNAVVALTVEGKEEADKKALCQAYEDAYDALQKAVYSSALHVSDDWMNTEALAVYEADVEDDLKTEYKKEYINDVAELLWEEMLENVTVELPKRAVRLAVKDQMDSYKSTYYGGKYKTHKTFKDYMKNEVFKDVADYKAAVKEDAEEMVKQHVLIFYLADLLEIDVSDKAITEDDAYVYRYMSLPEQTQTAFAFDKVMNKLMDVVYKDTMKTPRD